MVSVLARFEVYASGLTVIPEPASRAAAFRLTVAQAKPEVAPFPQYVKRCVGYGSHRNQQGQSQMERRINDDERYEEEEQERRETHEGADLERLRNAQGQKRRDSKQREDDEPTRLPCGEEVRPAAYCSHAEKCISEADHADVLDDSHVADEFGP